MQFRKPATETLVADFDWTQQELDDIQTVLPQAVEMLVKGGRLAAISFHSLEDRIVKRFIRNASRPQSLPPELPVIPDQASPSLKPVGKKIRASEEEIDANPRARSAILRVAEKSQ